MCITAYSKHIASTKKTNMWKEEFIKQACKRGYIRVYKVICPAELLVYKEYEYWRKPINTWLTGAYYGVKYRSGRRHTSDPGWHVYLDKGWAEQESKYLVGHAVITCYAKLSWLNELGYDNSSTVRAASFHTLVFPTLKKKDMTIREFRNACKKVYKKG